jgi:hypothetical protein
MKMKSKNLNCKKQNNKSNKFCFNLSFKGILSKHYHKIVDQLEKSGLPVVPAKGLKVLTQSEIAQMFADDVSSQDIN